MTQKILVLSGKKQSGKTSTSNFIHGYIMRMMKITEKFNIDPNNGNLLVWSAVSDGAEGYKYGMGWLDLQSRNPKVLDYLFHVVWPHVKCYNFADELKNIAINVFGLTYEQCYGTNEQKNTATQIRWKDIAFALDKKVTKDKDLNVFLTAREFLQHFGTGVCRRIYGDCWADSTYKRIQREGSEFAIIADGRFPNEIDLGIDKYNAKSLRLDGIFTELDTHESETALDDYTRFDKRIDNTKMDIMEKSDKVLEALMEWGWLPAEIK